MALHCFEFVSTPITRNIENETGILISKIHVGAHCEIRIKAREVRELWKAYFPGFEDVIENTAIVIQDEDDPENLW